MYGNLFLQWKVEFFTFRILNLYHQNELVPFLKNKRIIKSVMMKMQIKTL